MNENYKSAKSSLSPREYLFIIIKYIINPNNRKTKVKCFVAKDIL